MIKKYFMCLILVFLLLGVAGCGNKQVPKQQEKKVPVETTVVKRTEISNNIRVTGEIVPETEVQVAPKVSGKVTSVAVKVGDWVKKGQVLFSLEDTDYHSNLRNAEAALRVAQINYDQAKKQFDRMKILFEEGAVAQSEMDKTETALSTAAAQVEQAQVGYDTAQENLGNAVITAPIDGQVAAVNISAGEITGPQAASVSLVDMRVAKVKVNLSENLVSRVKVGQGMKAFVEALGKTLEGTVSNIAPSIDPSSKAFPVEVKIANPGGELRGGMVARLQLSTEAIGNALVLPTDAVIDQDGVKKVFTVEKGAAKERSVKTGISNEKYTQIVSGLKAGEEVIVKGNRLVGEGQKVLVVNKGAAGGAGK